MLPESNICVRHIRANKLVHVEPLRTSHDTEPTPRTTRPPVLGVFDDWQEAGVVKSEQPGPTLSAGALVSGITSLPGMKLTPHARKS